MDLQTKLGELDDVIDTLDSLILRVNSEDIKAELESFCLEYETQKQNLKNGENENGK